MSQHSKSRGRRVALATSGALTAAALGVSALLAGPAFADTTVEATAVRTSEDSALSEATEAAHDLCAAAGYAEGVRIGYRVTKWETSDPEIIDYEVTASVNCEGEPTAADGDGDGDVVPGEG